MKKNFWLRASYWVAAIVDFSIALLVLVPERVGLTEFAYPMGMTSAIAFSWGIMLLLADRKPVERRWVLIPTIIVVALLTSVGIYAVFQGLIPVNPLNISVGFGVLTLLTFSYFTTRITDS